MCIRDSTSACHFETSAHFSINSRIITAAVIIANTTSSIMLDFGVHLNFQDSARMLMHKSTVAMCTNVVNVRLNHKYTNIQSTQIHKYVNTQISKYTNTQIHRYTDTQMHCCCIVHCVVNARLNHKTAHTLELTTT